MKKEFRLKKNWEFEEVLRSNNFTANKYLIVYWMPAKSFKIGITVPKRFAGAVDRNFYKRQLKAIIHSLNLYEKSYVFVAIVRKDFIGCDYKTKKEGIEILFKHLLKKL